MPWYRSRFVHKIGPRPTDYDKDVELQPSDCVDRKTLGAALRKAKLLGKGERLSESRVERDGRVVAFPEASIWHSIILEPKA